MHLLFIAQFCSISHHCICATNKILQLNITEEEGNARPGPNTDNAFPVLPSGATNQHLSTPAF